MRFALLIALLVLIFTPLIIDGWLSSKDSQHSQTVAKYECVKDYCTADFDGDGKPGTLEIDRVSTPPPVSYSGRRAWMVVRDSQFELLRLPFIYADGTLRTHVAIRDEVGGARLLVFDHSIEGAPVQQVFGWNGTQMVQVHPSTLDQEILGALGARDDAGTWKDWAFYRSFRIPLLILYFVILLVVILAWFIIRRARTSNVRDHINHSSPASWRQ